MRELKEAGEYSLLHFWKFIKLIKWELSISPPLAARFQSKCHLRKKSELEGNAEREASGCLGGYSVEHTLKKLNWELKLLMISRGAQELVFCRTVQEHN